MSKRKWNSYEDRRKKFEVDRLFDLVVEQAHAYDSSIDSDSDSSSDSSSESSDDENPYVDALRRLVPLATQQNSRVQKTIEDVTIEFGQSKTIDDFSDSDCLMYFRFLKEDAATVAEQLWPRLSPYLNSDDQTRIEVGDGYIAHYETCLCLYLYKMSHPCRLICDCEKFFCIRKSKLSRMIIFFGAALCNLATQYLSTPAIWHERMPHYGRLISTKCGGLFPNMWGFIDGTIRRTCRPIYYQDVMYTRYKRCHGLKFQSVVTPDGYIACLAGPFVARRHDVRILHESGLLEQLQALMPLDGSNGPVYYLYGDLAYEQTVHLFSGFRNAVQNSPEALFNCRMSKVRIIVEWGFANVLRRWQHVDFQRSMKVFLQPVGQQYINSVFLTNIGNCFYGGAINQYFKSAPIPLDEYLALID